METVSDKLLEHAPAIDGTDWDMNQQCRDNRAESNDSRSNLAIYGRILSVTGVRWPARPNEVVSPISTHITTACPRQSRIRAARIESNRIVRTANNSLNILGVHFIGAAGSFCDADKQNYNAVMGLLWLISVVGSYELSHIENSYMTVSA